MIIRDEVKCEINKGMFGLFFEDINYALDGGLHAEMIENRSFEFFDCGGRKYNWYKSFDGLYGWKNRCGAAIKIGTQDPLNTINPHYLRFEATVPGAYVANKAYNGIFMKAGAEYRVSFWGRAEHQAVLAVEIRQGDNSEALCSAEFTLEPGTWQKYETVFTAPKDLKNGAFCLVAREAAVFNIDFVSMMPTDAVCGVFRRDLADALKELKPGFLRFPGGCVVEGNTLDNMYKWKLSVGKPEERKANWNRWAVHQNNGHGPFSHYNQTLGVGYFEYFELCEYIGAKPLPVCNVGMACQYESNQRFELEDDIFNCFVQDALDLIEFANGDTSTKWGALRAQMGHTEPFGLELVGIGNEQWETAESRFFERYRRFEKAIHEKYPEIKLIGSAGPDVLTPRYEAAWDFYRKEDEKRGGNSNFTYALDEHYYVPSSWMLERNTFYDDYPRNVGVFAGEYAAHVGDETKEPNRNCMEAAVAEAAFMTGLERNADVVKLASYAPLFARIGYTQWAPDMIWFDEETVCRTPNYYVQKFFATATAGEELVIDGLEALRDEGVFVSASRCKKCGKLFVKLVNSTDAEKCVELALPENCAKKTATLTTLSGERLAFNSIDNPEKLVPQTTEYALNGSITLKPMSVNILEIK